ncbi:MAG TPA: fluoride efflux transporter CrcB [Thermodesulfatator atlanticus]|uniref:Fluoride-specific ion channel FluC n=1 Tax=Thermodesulfatator atlanticus TaxID=501497 RepID=A0A7V5P0U9_9BACT|nr:fluoride efflux transporter CrcB [Thermodesulfatator atlanticus]
MLKLMLVGLGGFCGAVARYLVSGLLLKVSTLFPLGTLVVNVSGSFLLGFLMALATETLAISPNERLFLAIGFLGSFTTFSTFIYETNSLLEEGEFFLAGVNLFLSLLFGLLGLRLGIWLARILFL